MQQWSPSQVLLTSLPENLLAKFSVIENTEQVLEQMPQFLSSLDAYMVHGLQRVHLGAVTQLLANMEGSQVKHVPQNHPLVEEQ